MWLVYWRVVLLNIVVFKYVYVPVPLTDVISLSAALFHTKIEHPPRISDYIVR